MKAQYDYVFVTHLPAFYKVNLYNALAKTCRIFVIFLGKTSKIRSLDFVQNECHFDYVILHPDYFENRQLIINFVKLYQLLLKLKYRQLVVGGWDLPEFWWLVFLSPKSKNALALESSVFESVIDGVRAWLKKIFLLRVAGVFLSGVPHQKLLERLCFKGAIRKTQGVGIFNYPVMVPQKSPIFQGKLLYVGRLAPEKNLQLLLNVMYSLPQFTLTVIGHGPLYDHLKANCPTNVRLIGHVPNEELITWYQQHDIFILPSLNEPWGLVVEEALFYGLPVIVSNRVGCAIDLVQAKQVGVLFDPSSMDALHQAILWVAQHYEMMLQKIAALDFHERDNQQVQQYIEYVV